MHQHSRIATQALERPTHKLRCCKPLINRHKQRQLSFTAFAAMRGQLIRYGSKSAQVAFICDPPSPRALILLGGLTDGLLALPYVDALVARLAPAGWCLVQAQLSSSYQVRSGGCRACSQCCWVHAAWIRAYGSATDHKQPPSTAPYQRLHASSMHLSIRGPYSTPRRVMRHGPSCVCPS